MKNGRLGTQSWFLIRSSLKDWSSSLKRSPLSIYLGGKLPSRRISNLGYHVQSKRKCRGPANQARSSRITSPLCLHSGKTKREPLVHDILRYVRDQQYPESTNDNDKRTLRRLAMGFFLGGDVLYKKIKDQILLGVSMQTRPRKSYVKFMKGFVVHMLAGTQ